MFKPLFNPFPFPTEWKGRVRAFLPDSVKRKRHADDREFLPAALELMETPPSPVRIAFLYAICASVVLVLAWSYFSHLDVYASAPGKIQPAGRTKVIQPIEVGKVLAIRFRDGDRVKEGDVVIELDSGEATAVYKAALSRLHSLRAEIGRRNVANDAARLDAPLAPAAMAWDGDIPESIRQREERVLQADLAQLAASLENLAAQRKLKLTDQKRYAADLAAQRAFIAILAERVDMREQLFKKNFESRAHILDALQQVKQGEASATSIEGMLSQATAELPVLDSQLVKTRESFITENTEKLVAAERQVEEVEQQLVKAEVDLSHMTLRAPISGVVQATAVTTIGQVVTTSQELMHIVPEGAPLEIEAHVLNSDIGFVHCGQDVVIRVDAFPYTRYGAVPGKVTRVATDAIASATAAAQKTSGSSAGGRSSITAAAQHTQDLVFPVLVIPERTHLTAGGREFPLTPGMTVSLDIKTDRRRVIDYILSPLKGIAATAMRER